MAESLKLNIFYIKSSYYYGAFFRIALSSTGKRGKGEESIFSAPEEFFGEKRIHRTGTAVHSR